MVLTKMSSVDRTGALIARKSPSRNFRKFTKQLHSPVHLPRVLVLSGIPDCETDEAPSSTEIRPQ